MYHVVTFYLLIDFVLCCSKKTFLGLLFMKPTTVGMLETTQMSRDVTTPFSSVSIVYLSTHTETGLCWNKWFLSTVRSEPGIQHQTVGDEIYALSLRVPSYLFLKGDLIRSPSITLKMTSHCTSRSNHLL